MTEARKAKIKAWYLSLDAGFEPKSQKPVPRPFYFLYWLITLALIGWLSYLIATSADRFHNLVNSINYLNRALPYYFEYISERDPAPIKTSFDETDFTLVASSIGTTWETIVWLFAAFGRMLITKKDIILYSLDASNRLLVLARFLSMLVFAAIPLLLLFKDYMKSDTQLNRDALVFKKRKMAELFAKLQGSGYSVVETPRGFSVEVHREVGDKTLALVIWDNSLGFLLRWSKAVLRGYASFLFGHWSQQDIAKNARKVNPHKWVEKLLKWMVVYYFNGIAAYLGFIAYYFSFFCRFDFLVLGKGFAMLAVHLYPALSLSWVLWLAFFWYLLEKVDAWLGKQNWKKLSKRNKKALVKAITKSREGPPGSGKTTGMTAEGEIKEQENRKAFRDKFVSTFAWFPYFPWNSFLNIEMSLMMLPESSEDRIGNTANAEEWAAEIYDKIETIWPYIKNKKSMRVWNGKETVTLKKAMQETAKGYLLFRTPGLMWASNYPIKTVCWISGNECLLPYYDYSYFGIRLDREPERLDFTYKADMNAWKIKRPVDDGKGCPGQGDFEGIVWTFSEFNKEYINKNGSYSGWRLDDGIAISLSYLRHYMTFWHVACADWSVDTQRTGDLPVSLTSRIEGEAIVRMQGDKPRNLLPLWNYRRWACELWIKISDWFNERCCRNDETLIKRFVASVDSFIRPRYESKLNQYNYETQSVYHAYHVGEGISTNETCIVYLFWCDIYADRMATDANKPLVNGMREKSRHSFRDLGKWTGPYPTEEEKLSMNGYEGRDLDKLSEQMTVKEPSEKGIKL